MVLLHQFLLFYINFKIYKSSYIITGKDQKPNNEVWLILSNIYELNRTQNILMVLQ